MTDVTRDTDHAAPREGGGVVVRQVHPGETALVRACGTLAGEVYGGEGLIVDEEGYLHVVADAAPRAREAVLLAALDGDRLLATATYATAGNRWAELARPGEAEMRMLAVAASARGRGVGPAVTRWCLDRARGEGCHRFVLSSGPRMTTAHRMYERMGFTRTPDRDWSPGPGIDLVTYAYAL
ncbi:GNAT family N-acetyltransferase [Aquipuribacter nitratireducens]|uniref:GNAT family N-acetyltransferase n=1 Tax=Aquipuribacter nitratireducens TaxID=650104 RepID=A0ABW0GL72_9MICO